MKTVSDRIREENQKNIFYVQSLFIAKRAVHETMCKNTVEPDRPQIKTRRKDIACWIPIRLQTHFQNT
jgi:hypothetical protein